MPQNPHSTCQTAVNEAIDTTNPHAMCAGPAVPVGTTNGLSNRSNEVEGKRVIGDRDERVSGDVAPSLNGENAIPDLTPPPPNPDESRPPPSTPLKGEKNGQPLSSHVDKTGTHLKPPGHEMNTTMHLIWMPYDEESSGECQQMAMGHRESEGKEIEVGVRADDTKTSYGALQSPHNWDLLGPT
ncbi:hypothetical protein BDN67DRAFT_1017448 [Paxillus ammoniavirescens]|nr:hypothetical protein BDN67DRAFT_1017448 [Paxillus ammoniavirescens]